MKNKKNKIIFSLIFFSIFAFPVFADTQIVDINDLDSLNLTEEQKTEILGQIAVSPEILSPTLGAVVSGEDLIFRGVATPNVNITLYIKDINNANSKTVTGKSKADSFGAWTYSLSSRLIPSNYTVMVTANDPALGTVNSDIIRFSVLSRDFNTNQDQIYIKESSSLMSSNNMWVLFVMMGTLTFTFLLAFVILILIFYFKEKQKTQDRLKIDGNNDFLNQLHKIKQELSENNVEDLKKKKLEIEEKIKKLNNK